MEETPKPNPPTGSDPPGSADLPAMASASGEPITVDELLRPAAGAETEPPAPDADLPRAASILESLLLVSTEPISLDKARQLLGGLNRGQVREVLASLRAKYQRTSRASSWKRWRRGSSSAPTRRTRSTCADSST